MNFLIIDGNSIINRAFYGIKILTASDGHPTNALYGFMNIMMSISEKYKPDAIAVAFDVHQPTFRHKMYDGYKAGRHPTPPELLQQMEPMKDLLRAYGCTVIECPGYEADDILGTLSHSAGGGVHCYISTGDRDSLQLVTDDVSVLLVTTKMGRTETKEYTPALLKEEYGLEPAGMIELKALQGDSSDNIKGVAGIGPKTAGDLIKKYGTIDYIYDNIDSIEATAKIKEKLLADKDSAFFSRTLGTICLSAPVDTDMNTYLSAKRDDAELRRLLVYHEMTKLISKLGLKAPAAADVSEKKDGSSVPPASKVLIADNSVSFFDNVKDRIAFRFRFEGTSIASFAADNGKEVCNFDDMTAETETELISVLCDEKITVFTTDVKLLYKWCFTRGIEIEGKVYDAEIMAYLLDPNRSDFSVNSLCDLYNAGSTLSHGTENEAVNDAARLEALCEKLKAKLESFSQLELYGTIELPLARVLAKMELRGMAVDKKGIQDFSVMLTGKIAELENKITGAAGEKFNINSPKQLGVILFEKLGLPAKKKTKTGYSTNADVLEELAEDYPIVADILQYRAYAKLKSTYCDGLLRAVESDGRVRSTFTQTETRTGRLSSVEPNLQNIPVRTPLGAEMRKFFVAEPGNVLVDADYSQIELRVLAALSDDTNMKYAFNSGVDIHTLTAAKVFGLPAEEVTHALRSKAKAVNFGIVYGIGAHSLSKDIGSTRKEAETFINSYLALYSQVDAYLKKCVTDAKAKGYAETYFGRRRYLPELSASNRMIQAFGERVAKNAPIQGTAADIIKLAMIKVEKRLASEIPDAALIMQVHDELILEVPGNEAEKASAILREEMESAVKLFVHLSVEVGTGDSWYTAKD